MNKKIILLLIPAITVLTVGTTTNNFVKADTTSTEPVYRLYNPHTGEHFYTSSVAEETADNNAGWNYEGIAWIGATTGSPVYRVYNPNAIGGDHYYTTNHSEASGLVSLGWKWDNNGQAVFYAAGSTNLYVSYNPNAQSGAHNYTTNSAEQNNLLSVGWKYGQTAWQVEGAGDPNAVNPNANIPMPNNPSPNIPQGPFNSSSNNQAFYSLDSTFNSTLENTMLADVNAYRAHYGEAPLQLAPSTTNFSHEDITWSIAPQNSSASAHSYFINNASKFSDPSYHLSGEISTIIGDAYSVESGNTLSLQLKISKIILITFPLRQGWMLILLIKLIRMRTVYSN